MTKELKAQVSIAIIDHLGMPCLRGIGFVIREGIGFLQFVSLKPHLADRDLYELFQLSQPRMGAKPCAVMGEENLYGNPLFMGCFTQRYQMIQMTIGADINTQRSVHFILSIVARHACNTPQGPLLVRPGNLLCDFGLDRPTDIRFQEKLIQFFINSRPEKTLMKFAHRLDPGCNITFFN
jgi:hypothetical protein